MAEDVWPTLTSEDVNRWTTNPSVELRIKDLQSRVACIESSLKTLSLVVDKMSRELERRITALENGNFHKWPEPDEV